MRLTFLVPPLLMLAACSPATLISETPGTFTDRGRTYPSVVKVFQTEDGSTFSRTTIRVGAQRVGCNTDDRLDCRAALTELRFRNRD